VLVLVFGYEVTRLLLEEFRCYIFFSFKDADLLGHSLAMLLPLDRLLRVSDSGPFDLSNFNCPLKLRGRGVLSSKFADIELFWDKNTHKLPFRLKHYRHGAGAELRTIFSDDDLTRERARQFLVESTRT
jgi:hypothetical protein